MSDPLIIPLRPVLIYAVVLARVGGLVSFAPFWGHRAANVRVRAVLALVLALVVSPVVAGELPTPPSNLLALAVVLAGELLVGLAIGFIGRVVFSGLEMAAQIFGFQMGFSLAGTIDPATRAQTAALGTIAQMFGLMVLLAADGHHWFLTATVRSYELSAPGEFHVTAAVAELFIRLTADALAVGVALAAPAIVVLLAVEFLLAVAGKAAPQLQVMLLGFPIKIAVGLWLVGASLYFLPGAVRSTIGATGDWLGRLLSVM